MVRKVPPIQTPSVVERLRARAQIPVDEWEGASQREEAGTDRRMSFMDGRSTRAEQEERSPEQVRVLSLPVMGRHVLIWLRLAAVNKFLFLSKRSIYIYTCMHARTHAHTHNASIYI